MCPIVEDRERIRDGHSLFQDRLLNPAVQAVVLLTGDLLVGIIRAAVIVPHADQPIPSVILVLQQPVIGQVPVLASLGRWPVCG